MITPIKAMTISQVLERQEDLLVSTNDIKKLAKNERANAIDECNKKIDYLKNRYVYACNMCTRIECDVCPISNFIEGLEQLKENKNDS